ncbi:hypothetical protein AVEN_77184-1 [Araneus ventricosus]|uniref:Uncharacterized protein n=1 Tax=Araneus ventricosus TaxID=182803 RepID=A0A4Y2TYB2_ARAVE|nr:hypothetical protein AVEN_100343-1 [Araneus ventricosus]GBO04347.1 hypothetical protein AVEN_77184-1 [Araneus ventricosus]
MFGITFDKAKFNVCLRDNIINMLGMKKEEYEEWISIEEDISVAATITDLEICRAVCEQDQAIKVDDSNGDECVEENPPTNAETKRASSFHKF